jgi:hypothetical protein
MQWGQGNLSILGNILQMATRAFKIFRTIWYSFQEKEWFTRSILEVVVADSLDIYV